MATRCTSWTTPSSGILGSRTWWMASSRTWMPGLWLSFGTTFDEPVLHIGGDIGVNLCEESTLGNFVTDAFRYTLNQHSPADPIVAAFESQGVIRDDFVAGASGLRPSAMSFASCRLALVWTMSPATGSSRSTSPHATSRAPARSWDPSCLLRGVITGLSRRDCDATSTRTSPSATPLGRLSSCKDAWVELDLSDNETLHHVAVDSYVASLMNILGGLTFDAVIIEPKRADGTVVEDTSTLTFDKDPTTEGVQEVKLWEALVTYASSFDDVDGDGVPDLGDRYLSPEGRIIFID